MIDVSNLLIFEYTAAAPPPPPPPKHLLQTRAALLISERMPPPQEASLNTEGLTTFPSLVHISRNHYSEGEKPAAEFFRARAAQHFFVSNQQGTLRRSRLDSRWSLEDDGNDQDGEEWA
eukprot:CAMPEP_0194721006 /NCGR_PEP_ID=MMETSP0296-20130528/12309_1 /TAXON_ID=39354 /ORGANISM="Heterosigma akashiwo, Strain CCMP2393" /LENGTH=118 /DNA_ID=CAMNT_0039623451 /DNA_START=399 /DNA_END=755 /DNA_ORIENTATION=-